MATKRKSTRKEAPPSATPEGRFSILMEQVLDQNRATIEAVKSLEQKMDRRFEEADRKNELRFSTLEAAVRQNSADIRKNSEDIQTLQTQVSALQGAVTDLQSDMRDVKHRLDELVGRIERIEAKLDLKADGRAFADLLRRVEAIEQRLGISPA